MQDRSIRKIIRVTSAVVTGGIALTGYAGVVGLIGGGLSFGPAIDVRLPYDSLVLAGLALLVFVPVPMTIAALALAAGHDHRSSGNLVFASGLVLVLWIAVQLAFIQTYSWFHPAYLAVAVLILSLGWLMNRWPSPATESAERRTLVLGQRSVDREPAASEHMSPVGGPS